MSAATFAIPGCTPNFNKALSWICDEERPVIGQRLNTLENLGYWAVEPTRMSIAWLKGTNSTICKIACVALMILSLPLMVLGITLRAIGKALPHSTEIRTDAVFNRTDPHLVDECYELLQAFNKFARQFNLLHLASSGTSLGLARHGGMIGWDDDDDINVLDTERNKLEQVLQALRTAGYSVTSFFDGNLYQVRLQNPHSANHPGTLDIFVMSRFDHPTRGAVYKCTSEFQRAKLPNEYFYQDELDSVQDFSFGPVDRGLKIPAMKKMTRYLHQNYGENCLTMGVQTHNHVRLFGFIPIPLPRLRMEGVRIVDHNCAQGNVWRGQSQQAVIE